ncbi:MAG: hypothetical protein ACR2NC_03220 [Thermodesulfobacteriota bacterium]
MKSFILISSIVYSLSLSLPPQSSDYMSLYEAPELENIISSEFESEAVQHDLMSLYVDPEEYQMTTSERIPIEAVYSDDSENEQLEVFGVKIPAESRK